MDVELLEIRDFLAAHEPFSELPDEALRELIPHLEIRYFRRDSRIPERGEPEARLFVVRSGAVDLHDARGELAARLGEGDVFGYRTGTAKGGRAVAIEDTLLYVLPPAQIDALCEAHPAFAAFFVPAGGERLRGAVARFLQPADAQVSLTTTPIRDLLTREPVTIPPEASIREAARRMSEERVSSILVVHEGHLFGIVTDRDLRARVVAEGLDYDAPVFDIATVAPLTISVHAYAFEALLLMARHNIHHLPVTEGGRVVGMITATDLTQRHSTSPVYLAGDVAKQTTVEGLREIAARIPALLRNLVAAGASAHSIGHVITALGDAITTRLLQMAEAELGSPPVDYAWVAAGSQARNEQTARSDQDNCLIIDDAYDEREHGAYFEALARYVTDGLNACGYVYCPGEMMARTAEWRQPLKVWKRYFGRWIDAPEPKALMLTCVFFDLRHIYGDDRLTRALRTFFLERSRGNRIFLAHMVNNALSHQPPLGFFRNFVLIRGGEHDQTFDIKHRGIIPIVDLARIYALAGGSDAVNTQDRLAYAARSGEITESGARDLRDALEFISHVRLEHMARQIAEGREPDNYVSPAALSQFERNHLKDAFEVVRTMQSVLAQRYQAGRF
ncbi:putative nucleotidyltransferase substrate binding domain-containing protein [Inmirania thermothiophila]|uniref:CBS domain-containing protein n=1 Tax=Inmirania thermothiophila TaxID=1750597 RepID=A0A3N1XTZ3_9GAMM|nr:putative nucleotidyltransferase substrate binding domain-containing protein [Inmirania thermothiophila]ROR29641.1 CBS domain-containing protein [Inmirania thermothiophila]